MLIIVIQLCVHFITSTASPLLRIDMATNGTREFGQTRRVINGREVHETRPYMVYLRPATNADPKTVTTNWLCGGVIIHARYILTSAACIEDVKHFYVVSGTYRWVPATEKNDECINNGAKRAVWKCVPKSYFFDGADFDNIRWMVGDIAVVKVEDDFNFEKRVRGCDFIPKSISYNNVSVAFEKAGSLASIAGWGATDNFGDVISRSTVNSPVLLEADLMVISSRNCKKRWDPRYHFIIDEQMICTKDSTDDDAMSAACMDEVNCKELVYSDEEFADETKVRRVLDPGELEVHGHHGQDRRRANTATGGFCENDHGGPLKHGQGKTAVVIGIISACQTRALTNKCYGPFLFTSVYRYRVLINCAIYKDTGMAATCKKMLRSTKAQMTETLFNWSKHPDGPAKTEDFARNFEGKAGAKSTRNQFLGFNITSTMSVAATTKKK